MHQIFTHMYPSVSQFPIIQGESHITFIFILAACVRSKESLSICPATQDNLEPILLLRSVDQQKQKDEILEPAYVPHP